jgi:hypothetical protein
MEKETPKVKHGGWATSDGNTFYPHIVTLVDKLEPGFYETIHTQFIGYQLRKLAINDRNLVHFPDSNSDLVVRDIQTFWSREELFRKHKFPYKRGILMYGPPGCGKSCTIAQITNHVISMGGLVMKYNRSDYFLGGMGILRKLHPTMPVVCLMEDLDELLYNESMSDVLNLLDGVEKAVDKVVFLGTTNKIKSLADNIKNRPSRFDRRFKFGPPNAVARKLYFETLFKEENRYIEIDQWVASTENFSFAHMKELFTSVVLLGNNFTEALNELKAMQLPPDADEGDDEDDLDD